MNLKEAFRYQKFLQDMLDSAVNSLIIKTHCIKQTKNHLRNIVDEKLSNYSEETTPENEYFENDKVIGFTLSIIEEREKICAAIKEAKNNAELDIDAAIQINMSRQHLIRGLQYMMNYKPGRRIETGYGQKFNVEGNQTEYKYDVEIVETDAYDRKEAKELLKKLASESDVVSNHIDRIKVNTIVNFTPSYNVNDTFDDAMNEYLSK